MKKILLSMAAACALSASAQFQISNSDFESWGNTNEPGSGWNSFVSADVSGLGSFIGGIAKTQSKTNTTKVTGYNSASAVQLSSKSIFGSNANGNLTTGRINMGSSTPTNAANYNYTDRASATNKFAFKGRPDGVEYWYKFTAGTGGDKGCLTAIIHGDTNYKDPDNYDPKSNDASKLIGTAQVFAAPATDWTRAYGAFTYTGNEDANAYILASFTTNIIAGASSGDVFIIDDVKFIYNSQLASLKVNGESVPSFSKDTYNYTVNGNYTEGCVTFEDDAQAATTTGSYDAATRTYTVVVKGQNIADYASNTHTYTIKFAETLNYTDYKGAMTIAINDQTLPLSNTTIHVATDAEGKRHLLLKDFNLDDGQGSAMAIGDIYVPALEYNDATNSIPAQDRTIDVMGGIPVNVQAQFYPAQGNYADIEINIDLMGMMKIKVNVVPFEIQNETVAKTAEGVSYGIQRSLTGYVSKTSTQFLHLNNSVASVPMQSVDMTAATIAANVTAADLKATAFAPNNTVYYLPASAAQAAGENVVVGTTAKSFALNDAVAPAFTKAFTAEVVSYSRSFTPGNWSTIYLPIAADVANLNAEVYTLTGVTADAFVFEPVTSIEANKPYLVKTTAALLFKENVGGEVALATAAVKGSTVATGVANVAQQGTYQSETLTSNATTTYFGYQNGQFVKANNATLNPYRSSFALTTAAGTRSAYALQIGTVTTGIERLNANSITDAPAYDLQGRRVNQLAKGAVYIINGQKVIIK